MNTPSNAADQEVTTDPEEMKILLLKNLAIVRSHSHEGLEAWRTIRAEREDKNMETGERVISVVDSPGWAEDLGLQSPKSQEPDISE